MIAVLDWLRDFAAARSEFAASEPNGKFTIQRQIVTGWVDKIPGLSKYPIKIEAFRKASLLLSCDAIFVAEKDVYLFTFSMAEKFTEEDVIREKVMIRARTVRGKAALLSLEPALQIDLTRRYLGVTAEVVLDIEFGSSGLGQEHLDQG